MKKEKGILSLLLAYFIFTFFYGIIIKITINNGLLFSLKTYIPELIIVLVVVLCLTRHSLRFPKWLFVGVTYYVFVIVLSIPFVSDISNALYVFRDFFLPVFAFIFLCRFRFSNSTKSWFFSKFLFICKVYLICGCVLGMIQMMKGWSWTANFYTGYSFYGVDKLSKVSVTEFLGRVRAPGLTGNFVTFSYYGLVACIFIVFGTNTNRWKKLFYILMQCGILVATLNKTAIAIYLIVLVFYMLKKVNQAIRYCVTVLFALIAVVFLIQTDASTTVFYSLFERVRIWKDLISSVHWYELLLPINSLNYTPMSEGALSFWDNTYFYLLFSQGVLGLLWIYGASYKVYKSNVSMYKAERYLFELMFVFLIAASAFNNITNGRSLFPIYLLLSGIFYSDTRARLPMQ